MLRLIPVEGQRSSDCSSRLANDTFSDNMVDNQVAVGRAASRFAGRESAWLPFFYPIMHLLYLDDAGSAANATEQYLVLGGVSIYEAQANWFTQQLDNLASGG